MRKSMKKLLMAVIASLMIMANVVPACAATQSPVTPYVPSDSLVATSTIALDKGLKVSQTGSQINVVWGKVSSATGYIVHVAYCGEYFNTAMSGKNVFTKTGAASVKMTIKKINNKAINLKKNYKIYVEAYKTVNGKKVIIATSIRAHIVGRKNTTYTNIKSLKITSKTTLSLKKGKTSQIKAKVTLVNSKKKLLSKNHAATFRYKSTNTKVATVTSAGKIKAVKKGTCYIYVYAKNGYAKRVKVTVK